MRVAVMMQVLMGLWVANRKVYGAHKLWKAARRAGHDIGRDQTARLMRIVGIEGALEEARVVPVGGLPQGVEKLLAPLALTCEHARLPSRRPFRSARSFEPTPRAIPTHHHHIQHAGREIPIDAAALGNVPHEMALFLKRLAIHEHLPGSGLD